MLKVEHCYPSYVYTVIIQTLLQCISFSKLQHIMMKVIASLNLWNYFQYGISSPCTFHLVFVFNLLRILSFHLSDECFSGPCLNNGNCVDQVNGFICECAPDFSGSLCQVGESCNRKKSDMLIFSNQLNITFTTYTNFRCIVRIL